MPELVCTGCGAVYPVDKPRWRCDCGGAPDLKFQPGLNKEKTRNRGPSMWRYREAIPIEDDRNIITLGEGYTPILKIPIAGREILVKQEQLFPTGSYKDRGASVLVSQLRAWDLAHVVEDSSGNAGSAIAAYCANAGIGCDIYVPAGTSTGKTAQVQLYGAGLHKVPGSREDTAAEVLKAAKFHYYASHTWNPFFFHGTKTFAYEVCEQLDWSVPDTVILPVGNGTLLLGAWIGFNELKEMGVTGKVPRFIGIQSARCAPLYQAARDGSTSIPRIKAGKTMAEGIAVAAPVRGKQIVTAVYESGGFFIAVSEAEIQQALLEIGRRGYFIEPTSAAAIAGIKQLVIREKQKTGDILLSVFTGHGLKTGAKILDVV